VIVGLFKDLRQINRQAKELRVDWDPGVHAQSAMAQMQAMNQMMSQTTDLMLAPDDQVLLGDVQITAVGAAAGMLDGAPMVNVSVLVMAPGRPPVPAQTAVPVPPVHVHRLQAGASLPARISLNDPTAFVIDWTRTPA
jgi:hypothetical protein